MMHFPTSWWRTDRPLVFGHRGASHAAPQNTLAAFRRAVEMGADGVELDVHLSADGVPVVIHDEKVDGTTDGQGLVTAKPLAELKELDAGSKFDPKFAGERIPTLEEVLAEVGNRLRVNIELKDYSWSDRGLESRVAALVQRMGLAERVWFSSFNPAGLMRVRKYAPTIPCGMLYDETMPLPLRNLWLAPLTPHEALHPHYSMITEAWARKTHRLGLWISTWTVDDPEVALKMAEWKVNVVITNEPDRILALYR